MNEREWNDCHKYIESAIIQTETNCGVQLELLYDSKSKVRLSAYVIEGRTPDYFIIITLCTTSALNE